MPTCVPAMLTGPLLRARGTRDSVRPGFLDPEDPRRLELADRLVALAGEAVARGDTRGAFEALVEEVLVADRVDHKVVRGLRRVLEDASEFATDAPIPPSEIRARLFAGGPAPRTSVPGGPPSAADRIAALAAELDCPAAHLARALFADLKDNQVLRACPVASGRWLLDRYNVALVQGLLLDALEVEIRLDRPKPERARQLFRAIRFHQLMHRLEPVPQTPGSFRILLDGPASLFRLSTRYGMALARFFPVVPLLDTPWTLTARVAWRRLHRSLVVGSADRLRSHLPDVGTWVSREEQEFEARFRALDSGWALERGAAVLDLGGEALWAPDWVVRRGDREALVEIVGVWRKAWLSRRLDLLARHGARNAVLVVSRALVGDKGEFPDLPGAVVAFRRVVPVKDVLAAVERVAAPAPGARIRNSGEASGLLDTLWTETEP